MLGTGGRAASEGTQTKMGALKRSEGGLCLDDTSEVILMKGDVALSDKNYTEFMVLQFPAAGMASSSKHGEVQGYVLK